MAALALGSPSVKIVGVLRPRVEEAADAAGGVAYTAAMTRYIQEGVDNSSLVTRQKETPETDVLTGLPFAGPEQRDADAAARKQAVEAWAGELSQEEWTRLYSSLFPDGAAAGLAPSGRCPCSARRKRTPCTRAWFPPGTPYLRMRRICVPLARRTPGRLSP